MEPLTLAKVNTTNNEDDAYDVGMTQEDYASICETLKQKSRGLLWWLYTTLNKRIELHRAFKLTREDDEVVDRFDDRVEHVTCLLIKIQQFISETDRF
jgi:hypothetical protein